MESLDQFLAVLDVCGVGWRRRESRRAGAVIVESAPGATVKWRFRTSGDGWPSCFNPATCKVCQEPFVSFGANALYCSRACHYASKPWYRAAGERNATCITCGQEFVAATTARRCQDCRQWNARIRSYGVTPAMYREMVQRQGGRCAICSEVTARLVIDHCHKTGRVRGLLCGTCNRGIGLLRDSPARLRAAARYVEQTNWLVTGFEKSSACG